MLIRPSAPTPSCLSAWPLMAAHCPRPFRHARSSAATPCPPPRTPSPPARRAYPRHLCGSLLRCPSVRPSPTTVADAADPAMAAGAQVPWCLRSSPVKPRAPTSVGGASGARTPWLAAGSDPDGQNRPARPSPPLCCICMFQVFQTIQIYVATVSS